MSNRVIGWESFGVTLKKMLDKLGMTVQDLSPQAVEEALQAGQKAWKANARAVLSTSYSRGGWGKFKKDSVVEFKSGKRKGKIRSIEWYGKTYKTGPYANSISHHMIQSGGRHPEGEIGSPSLPGLAHLLEKGHGGPGPAGAHQHIADAAEEAFRDFERQLDEAIDRAIDVI